MSNEASITPLNEKKYATWKIQCRMSLIKQGLWGIVSGSEQEPASTATADTITKYNTKKDKALATIVLLVDPSLLYLLGDPQNPKTVWDTLSNQFQKKSWANKLDLRRKLIAC